MKWCAISRNLPVDLMVRLPHPRSGDSHAQQTFLTSSAEKKTRNYDIECSDHHPSLSTLRTNGLSSRKMKWWAIHKILPVDVIVKLPHPRSRNNQNMEKFLAPSAQKPTRNHDIECSNHLPSLSTLVPKGLRCRKIKWWAIPTNLPVVDIVRLPQSRSGDSQGQETFLAPSGD